MKGDANDEVDPNVIRGNRSEQIFKTCKHVRIKINGHDGYVVRGLMKGNQMKRWCLQS